MLVVVGCGKDYVLIDCDHNCNCVLSLVLLDQ